MTTVDFLRHGETDAGNTLAGRTDLPLSAVGREAVVRQVAGRTWPVIVSSPLVRARETADIAAGQTGQAIDIDPDWREIDFGDWDGQARSELAQDGRLAAFYDRPDDNAPPNGETMAEARTRIARALDRIAARGRGPVLVVAHGGSIRVAISTLIGIPFEQFWAFRIACATRIRVEMGVDPAHGLWGEVLEIAQPAENEGT